MVALTGITGLMIPRIKDAVIIIRFAFLLLASTIGLYGYIFGVIGLLLHLFELRSFGVPYMLNIVPYDIDDLKDTVIRVPWQNMRYRPKFLTNGNRTKNTFGGRKK